jgi:hypothetical protein
MLEFLFGYALGSTSDGSSTRDEPPNAVPGDMYVNGKAIRKVQNPLEVKTMCAGWVNFYDDDSKQFMQGKTLLSIFATIYPKDFERYEILRVTRVLSQSNRAASFWFEFIEKEKLSAE